MTTGSFGRRCQAAERALQSVLHAAFAYRTTAAPGDKTGNSHFLDRTGGLDRKRVGKIELRGATAVIEVPDGWEARLLRCWMASCLAIGAVRARIASDRGAASGAGRSFRPDF